MAIPLPVRAQAAASQLAFWLPTPVRRAVAGRPVRIDGQDLALDAQLLLRLQKIARAELVRGSVEQSRALLDAGRHLVSGKPIEPVSVREIAVPTPDGDLPATLYTPVGLPEGSPLLVFFHGGGWVIGTRSSHDNAVRFLAKHAGVRVLSIEYRLAPEFPFPAATEDALAAFEYAVAKAGDLGADPARIAVGGDSAGGNLAAVTAQQAVRRGGPVPAFQLLIYPATDFAQRYRSQDLFAENLFLTDVHMKWFEGHYVPEGTDLTDPRLSPLRADDLSGLPPALIVTAGFDPLRDEGEAYAEKLREAGVEVALRRQEDLIHGFINFTGVGTRFREALAEMAGALRQGLSKVH
ncbi:alpha/beta hydrolase [Amycolatopsis mediterranei S699]|uniref:Alpha/beta hydrolase n=2 Tax=Amycolatopsis mediterranei TaxID=33910 RepID=A0A0H3DLH5_AMYMU|nr:alpha/beta hydrolase [Amycolatopsis mediterranei]ADJ50564.1 alpha/beta hydrolase [Amycolatopsis mediterranei U32]AEK47570.1 alpha/beta hydrolase [Amycolatopsis mediterranei S699]AFO82270.1 alpha/beta hydrolase [Amycolatopsis mediterranei S699]AGT89399.1 alpha/beta hydrolase [Amycolatopsis mediterranei RB]KDO09252.1 alpha/beta hydrolase [Amycolatopsis mediterranei]